MMMYYVTMYMAISPGGYTCQALAPSCAPWCLPCLLWVGAHLGCSHLCPPHPHTYPPPATCLDSQLIVGFVRPSPTGRIRPFWNVLHHNLGRVTVLSAWATLYMGIYMAHTSEAYQV